MFGLGKGQDRMKREIVVNAEYLETRLSVLENGQLEEFQVEHPTEQRIVGSIFKGRIQNLENELQAAFVDIGLKKNAFLHYWDMIPDDATRLEVEEGVSSKVVSRIWKMSYRPLLWILGLRRTHFSTIGI